MLRKRQNRKAFRQAKKAGGRVCCTFADNGRPIYFNVPEGATDDDISRAAFAAKHGRPISRTEEALASWAKARAAAEGGEAKQLLTPTDGIGRDAA